MHSPQLTLSWDWRRFRAPFVYHAARFVPTLPDQKTLVHAAALTALTALALVLFFHGVADRALWSSHEGRAGQNAQLMIDTGEWGMPTLYFGDADYQKPPLYYWMVAIVARLRVGVVDEFAVRLPAAAAGLVGVWLMYAIASAMWRPQTGFVAALVMATNLRYAWLARVGRIDMPLTTAIIAMLGCFWMAWRRGSRVESASGSFIETPRPSPLPLSQGESGADDELRAWPWLLGGYVAAAVAILLKGPVGVVLPGASIALFLAIERQPVLPWRRGFGRLMRRCGANWGVPLACAIASPWFVWATWVTDGAFFRTFFLHHHLDRTLGSDGLKPGPVWFYAPQLFADLFPWSVMLPAAIVSLVRRRRGGDADRIDDAPAWFALAWFVAMLVILSLVRFKRHDYALPLVPALAMLAAWYWERLAESTVAAAWRWPRILSWIMAACGVSAGIGIGVLRDERLATMLLESAVAERWLHVTDRLVAGQLSVAFRDRSSVMVAGALVIFSAGAVAVVAVHRRRAFPAVGCFAAAWSLAFVGYVDRLLPALEPLREQRGLAETVRQFGGEPVAVSYFGREDQQLMFYLGPRTRWLLDAAAAGRELERDDAVFVFIDQRQFGTVRESTAASFVELAGNTANPFGTHRDPVVLVTNAAGWQLVQSRPAAGANRMAN